MDWNSPGAIAIAFILLVPAVLAVCSVEIELFIKRRRAHRLQK